MQTVPFFTVNILLFFALALSIRVWKLISMCSKHFIASSAHLSHTSYSAFESERNVWKKLEFETI
jgi:hypothetical protein